MNWHMDRICSIKIDFYNNENSNDFVFMYDRAGAGEFEHLKGDDKF
jgi:hypothetical protein